MRGPEVDEDPGPAAPAVDDYSVTEGRVLRVSGRQILHPRQVPGARGGGEQGVSAQAGNGGPRQPCPRSPLVAPGGAVRRGPAAGSGSRQQQQQSHGEAKPQRRRALPRARARARSRRAPRRAGNADPAGRGHSSAPGPGRPRPPGPAPLTWPCAPAAARARIAPLPAPGTGTDGHVTRCPCRGQ